MKVIQQIKKEGKLVYYFLQETFVWKYYGMMILLIILSIITNLSFSYSFSTILSGGLGFMKWWTSILLVFVCGKIACTVCGFLYSQLSLKFKMRLKELYLHRISDKLLKADYTWIVKQRGGDLIGRSCEDINWCAETVAVYIPKLIKSVGLLTFNTVFFESFSSASRCGFSYSDSSLILFRVEGETDMPTIFAAIDGSDEREKCGVRGYRFAP